MTFPDYRRSLLAVAVATCGTTAYAQQDCQQQITRIEQEIQQQQLNQQRQTEVRDLLRAARQNQVDCQAYVSRAEQLMNQGTQTAIGQPHIAPTPPAEQPSPAASQAPVQEPDLDPRQVVQQQAQGPRQPQDETLNVEVDQAPAQVDVQTRAPRIVVKQQPAEVTVKQKPPVVEITQHEPEITVEQPKPEVQVNRAQPDVEVTQSKPEVVVRQAEPEVHVVQPEATARVQTEQAGQQVARQSGQSQLSLEELQGNQALSSRGEEIGEIQNFVRADDGTAHALVAVGGVWGLGERTIAVPLDQVQLTEDGDLQTQLSQQEIEAQQGFDEQDYEEIPQSEFAALEAELRGER